MQRVEYVDLVNPPRAKRSSRTSWGERERFESCKEWLYKLANMSQLDFVFESKNMFQGQMRRMISRPSK